MCRVVFLFSLLLAAAPAWSGAWLREKDAAFNAASVTAFRDPDGSYNYKTALYAEFGLRPDMTIGLDFEQNRDYFGHALVFARVPVADFDDWGLFAAEFGAGAHYRLLGSWAMYKLTLSYGKGFQTGWGSGWLAIDAAWENRTHDAVFRKLDITTGLSGDRLLNPMIQIETAYTPESSVFWTVRPSVLIRMPEDGTTWVLGLERNNARNDTGLKFAIWNTF